MCACFQRLVEVKLLSAAGRRERADERPLHHPNGIHKTLNQRRSRGCGWVKLKKEAKTGIKESGGGSGSVGGGARWERHTLRTALINIHICADWKYVQCKQSGAAGRQSRGDGSIVEVY